MSSIVSRYTKNIYHVRCNVKYCHSETTIKSVNKVGTIHQQNSYFEEMVHLETIVSPTTGMSLSSQATLYKLYTDSLVSPAGRSVHGRDTIGATWCSWHQQPMLFGKLLRNVTTGFVFSMVSACLGVLLTFPCLLGLLPWVFMCEFHPCQ